MVPTSPSAASFSVPSPASTATTSMPPSGRAAGEAGRRGPAGRLRHLEVVVGAERLLDHHPLAGRHRRRRRVHDQRTRTTRQASGRCLDSLRSARAEIRRAAPARDSSRGVRRWRRRSGRRFATRSTGVGPCPGSATRTPGSWSSGSPPPPTARTGPGGCSPATGRGTGSSRRCTAPASRTSRRRCRVTTGSSCTDAYITAAVRCAPPANKPTPEERDRCRPFLERELALLARVGVDRDARRVRVRGAAGRRSRDAGVDAAPTPRPRFGHGLEVADAGGHDPRLLPPEPAEHVHRQADRADARRGALAPRRPRRSPRRAGLSDDLADRVHDRDRAEHDRDGEAQHAVRRSDREVRAEACAGNHADGQRKRERPVDVAEERVGDRPGNGEDPDTRERAADRFLDREPDPARRTPGPSGCRRRHRAGRSAGPRRGRWRRVATTPPRGSSRWLLVGPKSGSSLGGSSSGSAGSGRSGTGRSGRR